jgi:hypothetical protein
VRADVALLAIFQGGRVYTGDWYSLNAIYPMPSLSHVIANPITQEGPEFLGNLNPTAPPLFREDSFDPTTRIRRGRFYTPGSPSKKPWPSERINHYPYAQPVGGRPALYDVDVYDSLQPQSPVHKSVVFLGGVNNRTAWHVVDAERLFNGETLFTLKSANTLGVLPEIIENALPAERRDQIREGFTKVADVAHNYMPVPIVDVCREFARVIVAAWLPSIGKEPKGDLGALIKEIPDEYLAVKSAAEIINRLHPRGKSAEHERQEQKGRIIRDVSAEDSELSVSLSGFLLREFGWAR